jgi:hypothetical protein
MIVRMINEKGHKWMNSKRTQRVEWNKEDNVGHEGGIQ